MAHFSIHK